MVTTKIALLESQLGEPIMQVLLSIKPEFAESILAGSKKYEFRKVIFRRTGLEKAP